MSIIAADVATTSALSEIQGTARNFYDFILSCASKRLVLTCWAVWKLWSLALATIDTDATFAWRMIALMSGIISVYIFSEIVVKWSSLRVLEKRALSTELTTAIGTIATKE